MFKHSSSTARITMAMIMALSLTVQAFPVTRSRIVFRVNPEKQTNPQLKSSAIAVATPPATVAPPSGPLAVGPIITATNRDLPGTTANTGDTITYNVVVTNSGTVDATAVIDYGVELCCAVSAEHIHGVQFHPEKSHRFGMRLLRAFAQLT